MCFQPHVQVSLNTTAWTAWSVMVSYGTQFRCGTKIVYSCFIAFIDILIYYPICFRCFSNDCHALVVLSLIPGMTTHDPCVHNTHTEEDDVVWSVLQMIPTLKDGKFSEARAWGYWIKFMLNSMLVTKDVITWLLIGWRLYCQLIRCQVWKPLLTYMNFYMAIS